MSLYMFTIGVGGSNGVVAVVGFEDGDSVNDDIPVLT